MDPKFWSEKWANRKLGFHEGKFNSLLEKHISNLSLDKDKNVFIPLAGKTKDLLLFKEICKVMALELVETAVQEFFSENDIGFETISISSNTKLYRSNDLEFYCGDIFQFDLSLLNAVDLIYDRAAMVALPLELREEYQKLIRKILGQKPTKLFLITFEYPQDEMNGPPFSVDEDEVRNAFRGCQVKLLETVNNLKNGKSPLNENFTYFRTKAYLISND